MVLGRIDLAFDQDPNRSTVCQCRIETHGRCCCSLNSGRSRLPFSQ